MAMAARLSMMGENGYGEREKDANSVLMDLDKGLRSSKLGEQCESIVRFPRLFEKYPFPILINSAFLKLADVFRVGSNFLRLCVLRVTQQSERHLDKILNIDEILRRIFSVMHSNDPVARAITLRTLGSVACIISEKKNVHHSIHSALDSHDSVEMEAAIIACMQFSAQSKTFATGIFSKLSEMIQGLATPVDMKIKLIPVFQHMHHDSNTTVKVRELCVSLLPKFPAQGFVLTTLHTLTKLSVQALFDIPQQTELLLGYLLTDRRTIKVRCLHDLHLIARKGPHMWTAASIEKLCSFAMETPYDGLKIGTLRILATLSNSIAASHFCTEPDGIVMQLCQDCCYHVNTEIASKTTQILTNLAIHLTKGEGDVNSSLCQEACSILEAMISVTCSEDTPRDLQALKVCLYSVRDICLACPSVTDRFVDTMITCLQSVSERQAVLLCECLAAVSSQQNDYLQGRVPDILATLQKTMDAEHAQKYTHKLTVPLITLLFQASIRDIIADNVQDVLKQVFQLINPWLLFKVGRLAARYGHHGLASQIFKDSTSKVSTEQHYFWLSALHSFCKAEEILGAISRKSSQFINKVTQAEVHYNKGISSLKAASTPNCPLEFQCQYGRLRVQMFQAHAQMTKACCSFKTNPPPAIASSLAIATGLDLHRCGHVVAQLLKCGRQFQDVSHGYADLYQTLFDVDPGTLVHIQLLQQSCSLIAFVIDALLNNTTNRNSGDFDSKGAQLVAGENPVIEYQGLIEAGNQVLKLVHETVAIQTDSPLSYQHIECLQKCAALLLQIPLCLPRYFFQEMQATGIKLAISPQPKCKNEPITIQNESHLTLKVEGVIQHGSNPGIFRKVHQVHIAVNSIVQSRATIPNDLTKPKKKKVPTATLC